MRIPTPLTFTVTQLNQQVKYLLEQSFPCIWVEGEISNLANPGSGHWYFSLKDESAQVRCAMFRGNNQSVRFLVKNGTHVLVKARVSLYQARGDFQLIIEEMQEAGLGKLQQQFEALKKELAMLGWFDEERKKSIPALPETIGIITSPTGAAIQDILRVLKRRYCNAQIIIYPTLVQGKQAALQIAEKIKTANQRNEVDILLLARGGGSLEDLWAFNEKNVAQAIYNSHLPIITGIGHEVDFTIADFVADLRAPTPSAAAEIVSPDQSTLKKQLKKDIHKLNRIMRQLQQQQQQHVDYLQARLIQTHPQKQLQKQVEKLLTLKKRLYLAENYLFDTLKNQYQRAKSSLRLLHPARQLTALQEKLTEQKKLLEKSIHQTLRETTQHLASTARALHTVSPLATLDRGYAVVKNIQTDSVVDDASQLKKNDNLNIRFHKGNATCQVLEVDRS